MNARDALDGFLVIMWACVGLVLRDSDNPPENRDLDRLEIIEYLAAHGADVDAQANDGETALHIAAKYHPIFIKLLLRSGADPTVETDGGMLPIDWSRDNGLDEAASLLEAAISERQQPS